MHFPPVFSLMARFSVAVEKIAQALGWTVSLFHPPWPKTPPADAVPPRPPDTGKETHLCLDVMSFDPRRRRMRRHMTVLLVDGVVFRNGEPEALYALESVRGVTPNDGAEYLDALSRRFDPHNTAVAYGAPMAIWRKDQGPGEA